jgi:acetylornithine aminotransferase
LLTPGQHGTTFGGNPVCAAAALAVLATVDAERLGDHAAAVGKTIASGVEDLGHPLVSHVRGAGLLLGIVLTAARSKAVESAARDAGYLVNAPAPDVIRLAPPLVLTDEQARGFVGALPGILDAAAEDDA